MLVSALIFSEMKEAVKDIKGKSLQDCLMEARMLKAHKRMNKWTVTNCLKKQKELFEKLGVPLTVENLLYT